MILASMMSSCIRAITACSCSFFSLIPPNFTSHTCCMISAILYSFVYYNFARRSSSKQLRCQIPVINQRATNQNTPSPECWAFKSVYETSAVSLFARRIRIFEQKRDCLQSITNSNGSFISPNSSKVGQMSKICSWALLFSQLLTSWHACNMRIT